ncbi:phosphoenolpyruvate--protein phosphotransferase [Subdoligranulum sp. DSM 109015]|uniref:Phosphoenolpyruvate-protein phosphotransferase n=1 Tax=Gemmiger gallinarum TaxID=2779354 RepID=A0ABR9R5F3_9FIRM|nr:phosphoenolpyruvate--protein phosphotransferase [Gemmiger gallinarum]MBE5038280.1 phosphoenolpyruvate--protein phosphotransferase [Gemmiger gallinarum]
MITIQGKGVSSGVGIGPLYFYHRAKTTITRYQVEDVDAEWHRFKGAQTAAIEQLGELAEKARAEAGDEAAMLFETHQMMAEDLDYEEAIEGLIKENKSNAEAAVTDVAVQFAQMFESMDDSYMQARAADVKDVSRRILSILNGTVEGGIASEVPVLLAADDLAPSETVQLDKTKILGFITAGGSGSSHTAILARTMGIPAIVGVGDALKPEYEGRQVIIDGATGNVVIDPDDMTRDRLLKKREEQLRLQRLLESLKGQPNITKDGKSIRIYCNIGSPEDVHAVQVNDGGGIGLFRSEFLYLNCDDYPTEDQQFEAYKQVLSDMEDKEVIIRTCDIGADKQIGYFNLPKEDNPAMGMRALRISLTRPDFFRTQLRALFRASAFGKLGIMFPMVTSVWEVREAKKLCEEVKRELKAEGIPYSEDVQIGIMIETPAAAIMSDRLAKEVDFFSCGTNDLTQYTLACDRQNNDLGRFYDPHHPAVLRLLQMVVENAHKNGIWVGICGELGADLTLTETFLAIGIDELSVSPRAVLPLRNAVRMTDTRESSARILDALNNEYQAT